MDIEFLKQRLAATKQQIIAYEAASLALAGGAQSYMLDTGQGRQSVTKHDVADLQNTIEKLYARCDTLSARIGGTGVMIARPGW